MTFVQGRRLVTLVPILLFARCGGDNITLQAKHDTAVQKARDMLRNARLICMNNDYVFGSDTQKECAQMAYLGKRLMRGNHCTRQDAEKIQNAFRLRVAFETYCSDYNKVNMSLAPWADKANIKDHIKKILPNVNVLKTYAVVRNVEEMKKPGFYDSFPESFVMKGTHGSQMTVLVNKSDYKCIKGWTATTGSHCLDTKYESLEDALYAHCEQWLNVDFGKDTGQLFYSAITPACIFEESLIDKEGKFPEDIKYYTGGGQILWIVHMHASDKGRLYDPNVLPDYSRIYFQHRGMCKEDIEEYDTHKHFKNSKSEQMAKIVAKLFSYVRVDFFDTDPPYLQEITLTPSNCKPLQVHHTFTSWIWGYIMLMQDNIAPSCISRANDLSLCNKKIYKWLMQYIWKQPRGDMKQWLL
eukprot:m.212363 g.212363  ORF g.212363 m.212363 type:complete len:412 (+) comp15851_c1_seq1:173-1408(+)